MQNWTIFSLVYINWQFYKRNFICTSTSLQVSTPTGIISHFLNLQVVVPEAFILGSGELHVDMGSTINLVCIIEKVSTKTHTHINMRVNKQIKARESKNMPRPKYMQQQTCTRTQLPTYTRLCYLPIHQSVFTLTLDVNNFC